LVAKNVSRDLKRVHELFQELDCSNAGSRFADDLPGDMSHFRDRPAAPIKNAL
jgi:hypothetical protein